MKELTKVLEENVELLEKGIDAADLSETANSGTLRPQLDLVPFITDVSGRSTPVVDMLMPRAKKGIGKAHVFNKTLQKDVGTLNLRDAAYADGNLPQETTSSYSQESVAFKSLGWSGFVTGLAEAQGGTFLNLYETEVKNKLQLLKESVESLFYWGSTSTLSPTTNQAQFPGLDELVTNTVDAGGAKLSGPTGKAIIDQAANLIGQNGGYATHLMTSFRTAQNISNTYNNNQSLQIIKNDGDGGGDVTWGELVPQIRTSVGTWKVVADFFINPGNQFTLPNGVASTPNGATTTTAFVVNADYMDFVNLIPMMLEPLGRRTDKFEFFVKVYTVLEVLATEYFVKIINIDDTLA